MDNRLIRVTLVTLAAIVAAGAMYIIVHLEGRTREVRDAQQAVETHTEVALESIADLQSGQRGYVAVGQGTEFWADQVADARRALDSTIEVLRGTLVAPASLGALDSTASALENFARVDERAIDFVTRDQPLLASNLIFSDGLEATAAAADQIRVIRTEEASARDLELQRFRQQQAWSAAAGGALLLLLSLALLPSSRVARAAGRQVGGGQESDEAGRARLSEGEADAGRVSATGLAEDPSDGVTANAPGEAPAGAGLSPVVLHTTARLCTELGRVVEPTELSPLLARAATVLEASGLVVWLQEQDDAASAILRPALTHGYSSRAQARLETLSGDADNVAAEAYRSGHAQVVAGGLAVPLLTPGGCSGVLAAEFESGAERRESTQALASILAAQLATLLAPVDVGSAGGTTSERGRDTGESDAAVADQRRAAQGS